jgi:betaine lipid synthase
MQSALLELKSVAIQKLDFEDTWQLFGEGVHPRAVDLFETRLAPFLSQTSNAFWTPRLWYFKQGLYYQGGMVSWAEPQMKHVGSGQAKMGVEALRW